MSYAWVFNLDADFELANAGYTSTAKLAADLAVHGAAATALMGLTDVVLMAPGGAVHAVRGDLGRAWCPTERALSVMRSAGVKPEPSPSPAILRRVNHRSFAHSLGGGLPQQHFINERIDIEGLLPSGRWLLKRPLAFAGRGQLRLDGPLTDKQSAWIDASLRQDGLIMEPLVEPTRELSLHGFIWRDGHFELGRVCQQEVSRGVYRGITLAAQAPASLATTAARVATALRVAGYFGPFGIDAYEHTEGFCALSEINARYTMGFATGFPRPASSLVL